MKGFIRHFHWSCLHCKRSVPSAQYIVIQMLSQRLDEIAKTKSDKNTHLVNIQTAFPVAQHNFGNVLNHRVTLQIQLLCSCDPMCDTLL